MTFTPILTRVGCGEKIPFESLQYVAETLGMTFNSDTAKMTISSSSILTTIDKVGRFCDDLSLYARLTVQHIIGDIIASNGSPRQMSLCIEAGPEIVDAEMLKELTRALKDALCQKGIAVGNVHSLRADYTAITGCAIGVESNQQLLPPNQGSVFLSDRIGYFKMLMIDEMDETRNELHQQLRERIFMETLLPCLSGATDVSGFGLGSALVSLSARHGLEIRALINRDLCIHPDVYSIPVRCIDAKASTATFTGDHSDVAEKVSSYAELAGPLLMLCNDGSEREFVNAFRLQYHRNPIKLGEFHLSPRPRVEISHN